jgi:hypothetical protein
MREISILVRQIATIGIAGRIVVQEAKDEYQDERNNNDVYDDFKS